MKKLIAISALVLLAGCAHSPKSMTVLGGSHHVNAAPGEQFNEFNPGVVLSWDGGVVDWNAAAFLNSYGRPSVAGFASMPLIETDPVTVSVFGGVGYYPVDGRNFAVSMGDLVPMGGLQVEMGGAVVQLMPSDGKYTDAIVSFGWKFDL